MPKSAAPAVLKVETIASSLTQRLPMAPTVIAGQVVSLNEQAEKAVAVADRAVVNDQKSAGNAADVIRSINAQLKLLDQQRKTHTDPMDAAKKQVMDLFRVPFAKLEAAKTVLTGKANKWRRIEEARLTAEAEEHRKEKLKASQAAAAAQSALGDAEGAKQILEEAAALPVEVEKLAAVGTYGSVLGSRKRSVGRIKDRRKFLLELLASQDPAMVSIVEAIEFPQGKLNALASAIHKGEALEPAGFEAVEDDTSVVR